MKDGGAPIGLRSRAEWAHSLIFIHELQGLDPLVCSFKFCVIRLSFCVTQLSEEGEEVVVVVVTLGALNMASPPGRVVAFERDPGRRYGEFFTNDEIQKTSAIGDKSYS